MLIDVNDPVGNMVLNGIVLVQVILAVVALIPWEALGAQRLSRMLRWLLLPVGSLAVVYEAFMPRLYDIRLDLVLLVPLYLIATVTSGYRWIVWRRKDARAGLSR